jgi:manganese/zinc/iron transport system permease protein
VINYNTLVVLLGTSLLGANAGLVGSFAVLRQRALLGDALAHAALPGLCLAFLLVGERSLPAMQLGALATGVLGVMIVAALRRGTRIKEDAAIGIVLSVFFGLGIVLVRLIQNQTTTGSKAGLDSYIYGKTAGMLASDVYFIAAISLACLVTIAALFKEFRAVSFDPGFARVQGLPTFWLDFLLMSLISLTVVIGLPAVGVVMIAALLILPAAAARFWTERLGSMVLLASVLGCAVGAIGTTISARYGQLPTGPVIVLVGTLAFVVSVLVAPRRGVVARAVEHWQLRRRIRAQRCLRLLYEASRNDPSGREFSAGDLRHVGELSPGQATRCLSQAQRSDWLEPLGNERWRLTDEGARQSQRADRAYRIWRVLLTEYPDQVSAALDLDFMTAEERLPVELRRELETRFKADAADPG